MSLFKLTLVVEGALALVSQEGELELEPFQRRFRQHHIEELFC